MTHIILDYLKNIADSLNPYSNLLIVVLTVGIVYLTYRSLRFSYEALRFNALPILFSKVSTTVETSTFTLENHSNYPAYDVDLWVIGQFDEEVVPYKSLLDDKYKKGVKINFSKCLYEYESTTYGVVDRVVHYAFPPKTKCDMKLDFVMPPETLYIVLQYRDSFGHNYLYQSWLFGKQSTKNKRDLSLGYLVYKFKPAKRISYNTTNNMEDLYKDLHDTFKFTSHVFLLWRLLRLIPICLEYFVIKIRRNLYLDKEARDILMHSFPSGYQKIRRQFWIEGRGDFIGL